MTFDELKSTVIESPWFERLTEPGVDEHFVQIVSLAPWANEPASDGILSFIADRMDWLPSSVYQDDPIGGRLLEDLAERTEMCKAVSQRSMDIYKAALAALRNFRGHPALKVGPHDFTEAARGAALFACRRAAYEVLLGKPGFWCRLMRVYQSGHWPCGILPDGQVVVL